MRNNLDRIASPGFQLVVHRIPWRTSSAADVTNPPARRATAAFKPVYFVPRIAHLRAVAELHGGVMEAADQEWSFEAASVCDGLDPEGNVIQFREHVG